MDAFSYTRHGVYDNSSIEAILSILRNEFATQTGTSSATPLPIHQQHDAEGYVDAFDDRQALEWGTGDADLASSSTDGSPFLGEEEYHGEGISSIWNGEGQSQDIPEESALQHPLNLNRFDEDYTQLHVPLATQNDIEHCGQEEFSAGHSNEPFYGNQSQWEQYNGDLVAANTSTFPAWRETTADLFPVWDFPHASTYGSSTLWNEGGANITETRNEFVQEPWHPFAAGSSNLFNQGEAYATADPSLPPIAGPSSRPEPQRNAQKRELTEVSADEPEISKRQKAEKRYWCEEHAFSTNSTHDYTRHIEGRHSTAKYICPIGGCGNHQYTRFDAIVRHASTKTHGVKRHTEEEISQIYAHYGRKRYKTA